MYKEDEDITNCISFSINQKQYIRNMLLIKSNTYRFFLSTVNKRIIIQHELFYFLFYFLMKRIFTSNSQSLTNSIAGVQYCRSREWTLCETEVSSGFQYVGKRSQSGCHYNFMDGSHYSLSTINLFIYICLCSPEQLENPLLCMISRILLYPDTPQTQAQHLLGIMKILCIQAFG